MMKSTSVVDALDCNNRDLMFPIEPIESNTSEWPDKIKQHLLDLPPLSGRSATEALSAIQNMAWRPGSLMVTEICYIQAWSTPPCMGGECAHSSGAIGIRLRQDPFVSAERDDPVANVGKAYYRLLVYKGHSFVLSVGDLKAKGWLRNQYCGGYSVGRPGWWLGCAKFPARMDVMVICTRSMRVHTVSSSFEDLPINVQQSMRTKLARVLVRDAATDDQTQVEKPSVEFLNSKLSEHSYVYICIQLVNSFCCNKDDLTRFVQDGGKSQLIACRSRHGGTAGIHITLGHIQNRNEARTRAFVDWTVKQLRIAMGRVAGGVRLSDLYIREMPVPASMGEARVPVTMYSQSMARYAAADGSLSYYDDETRPGEDLVAMMMRLLARDTDRTSALRAIMEAADALCPDDIVLAMNKNFYGLYMWDDPDRLGSFDVLFAGVLFLLVDMLQFSDVPFEGPEHYAACRFTRPDQIHISDEGPWDLFCIN